GGTATPSAGAGSSGRLLHVPGPEPAYPGGDDRPCERINRGPTTENASDRPALERMGRGAWRTVALARCRPVARSGSPSGHAAARDVGRNPPRPEPHRRHLRGPPELRVRA